MLGEVQQLQWELSRREAQRCALTAELSALSVRAEEQEARLQTSTVLQDQLSTQLSSLRTEYDALLQLYGEKLEETQELRLDLQDVKDMYKAQVMGFTPVFPVLQCFQLKHLYKRTQCKLFMLHKFFSLQIDQLLKKEELSRGLLKQRSSPDNEDNVSK